MIGPEEIPFWWLEVALRSARQSSISSSFHCSHCALVKLTPSQMFLSALHSWFRTLALADGLHRAVCVTNYQVTVYINLWMYHC